MSDAPVVNHADIINWFVSMRKMGFNIAQVGHDRKFCREYFVGMKEAGFKIIDQPQYYLSEIRRLSAYRIGRPSGRLFYLHSEAFEYCVENVRAVEKDR